MGTVTVCVWCGSNGKAASSSNLSFIFPWEGVEPALFKDTGAQKAKHSVTKQETGEYVEDTP